MNYPYSPSCTKINIMFIYHQESLNDTLPAKMGLSSIGFMVKEAVFFQTPKRLIERIQLETSSINHRKRWNKNLNSKSKHLEMELEYTKKLIALIQKGERINKKYQVVKGIKAKICIKRST